MFENLELELHNISVSLFFIHDNFDLIIRCIERADIIFQEQFTVAYIYYDDKNRNYSLGFL